MERPTYVSVPLLRWSEDWVFPCTICIVSGQTPDLRGHADQGLAIVLHAAGIGAIAAWDYSQRVALRPQKTPDPGGWSGSCLFLARAHRRIRIALPATANPTAGALRTRLRHVRHGSWTTSMRSVI